MGPAAHSGPSASFPAPVDSMQERGKERSRCRWRPHTCASALAARTSSCLCVGIVTVQLSFLLSTLLLDMKHEATDGFMRDTILLCNRTKWFVVLYNTMNNHRPVGGGNTICWVFWSWSPFAYNWKRADVMCFILSQHVLDLETQCARRSKEEGENW